MLSSTCQRGKTRRTIHHLWQHRPSAIDGMNWRKMCGAVGAWSLRDGFTEVIRPLRSQKADCLVSMAVEKTAIGLTKLKCVKGKVDGFSSFASSNTLSRSNFLQGWENQKTLSACYQVANHSSTFFLQGVYLLAVGALCESQLLLVHALHCIHQPHSSPWSSLNRQPSNFHCSEKAKEKLL